MLEFNATFFIAMLSFVVFIFIMNTIFYKPILNIIQKREEYILSNMDSAKEFEQKAKDNTENYKNNLDIAKEQGSKEIAKTLDNIQKASFAQIQQTKEFAKDDLNNKKENLNKEAIILKENLTKNVESELSSIIVSKIFSNKEANIR